MSGSAEMLKASANCMQQADVWLFFWGGGFAGRLAELINEAQGGGPGARSSQAEYMA